MTSATSPTPADSTGTCDVLFLVKNDSGLGHIRRAVLLAKDLRRIGVSSVIVSQASSLGLFDDPDIRVVNFPLLERLKSSAAEEAYADLLDAVAARLDPVLVVEDTYPDHRYLSTPSLRGLPRVLVLRRLDPVAFEHVRAQGGFSHYDRVLVVQDRADFDAEAHTPAARRLVATSGLFSFCGPVFHEPTAGDLRQVDETYQLGELPLVVVTAGSGGDQLNDAYSERLFGNVARVADRCRAQGLLARFVLVLGPYYRGRPLSTSTNVKIVGFEPRLPALLRRARVVVMRPGHNVLHEALGGEADLVLVPGIPWMEGQQEFAETIARQVGACVVDVDDIEGLEARIIERLTTPQQTGRRAKPQNGTATVSAAIAAELDAAAAGPTAPAPGRLIAIVPPVDMADVDAARTVRTETSRALPTVRNEHDDAASGFDRLTHLVRDLPTGPPRIDRCVYVDREVPAGLSPVDLANLGVTLMLYADEGDIGMLMRQWLAFAGSERPTLVDGVVDRVVAHPWRTRHIGWSLARGARCSSDRGLLIDCSALDEADFAGCLSALRRWLNRLRLEPLSLEEFTRRRVVSLYGDPHGGSETG